MGDRWKKYGGHDSGDEPSGNAFSLDRIRKGRVPDSGFGRVGRYLEIYDGIQRGRRAEHL